MNNTNAKGIPLPKHKPTENINPTPTDSVQALKEELATVFKKDNIWGRNRDADVQNRLVDTVREGEGGMNWESSIDTYTLPTSKTDS